MSSNKISKGNNQQDNNTLFYKFLIVQLDTTTFQPSFAFRWLPGGKSTNQKESQREDADDNKIQQFCYPESSDVLQSIYNKSQETIETFSFILTDSLGRKSFAFCKRVIKKSEILCFCFISKFPYFKLFERVIASIESKYGEKKSKYNIHSMLQALVAHPLPSSSTTIEVKTFASNSQSETFIFPFSKPRTLFDHISYELLFKIKPAHLIKLFECILMESRIILLSSSTSLLSNTILALQSLVYPFVWQHIFVSILPISLMPYVAAPIPFLVGILDSSLKSFYDQPTEQVILYNLDKLEFLIFDPNYKSHLPYHINQYLNNSLKKIRVENQTYNSDLDVAIRKPFFSTIYHLFKNYFNYMNLRAGVYTFQKDQFLESQKGQSKTMLEHIVNSQMVEMFFSEREKSFSDAGEINCSYLNSAKDLAEVILEYTTNTLNKYDCPVCSQTTIAEASIDIHNLTIHTECFKCKQCGCSLIEMEREKVVIKKKTGGEHVKIFCADCRVTFMNKSKSKFYAFIKNIQDSSGHSSNSEASQSYSTFPASMYSNINSNNSKIQVQQQQQQQQAFPVKQEILDFKFKNKGPPPKDIGRKSNSFTNILSLTHQPVQKPYPPLSNPIPPPPIYTNTTPSTSPSSSYLGTSPSSNQSISSLKSTPPKNNSNLGSFSVERKVPPLPPTPGERKERAIEQMKQRNINVPQLTQETTTNNFNSNNSNSNSNSIPSFSKIPSQQSQPQVQPLSQPQPQSQFQSQPFSQQPPEKAKTQLSKPLPAPRSYTISGGDPPVVRLEPLKPLDPLPKPNFNNNINPINNGLPKTKSPILQPYKPPGGVVKKSGRPLPIPPIPPQPTIATNAPTKPIPPTISPRQKPLTTTQINSLISSSSVVGNNKLVKKPLPPTSKVPGPSSTINFISISDSGSDLTSSFGSTNSASGSEPSSPSPSTKLKPPPPPPSYPPLSLSSSQFNQQQNQQQKQYQVNSSNRFIPGNSYKNYINSISHSSTNTRSLNTNNYNTQITKSTTTTTTTTTITLKPINSPQPSPRLNQNSSTTHKQNPSPSTRPRQNTTTTLPNNINNNSNTVLSNSKEDLLPQPTTQITFKSTNKPITSTYLQSQLQPQSGLTTTIERSQRRLNKVCNKCKEPFTNYPIMMANSNHYYHRSCFTCEKCFLPLEKDYFFYNGLLYHLSCSSYILPQCSRCNLYIKGRFLEDFKKQPYHESCFSCFSCNRSLIGIGYQEYSKQYYCKHCGDSL